jgi:hypothetical protein
VADTVIEAQHWLTSVDAKGQRRLDNQDDFVRMEIEGAFRRHMRVIPVLVQGARMPRTQDLPESLAPLTRLHAFELTDSHWRSDIGRLINPTATLLEHTLLTQRFTGTSNAAFPRCLRPQNRDSTWANLVDTLK